MLAALIPAPFIGVLTFVGMFCILMLTTTLMLPGLVGKLIPIYSVQRASARWCVRMARGWAGANQKLYRLLHPVKNPHAYGNVEFNGSLDPGKSYLLISNHQTWADILILFDVFHGKVPFLRFFMKRNLLWLPLVGYICWAMDFPFMKRHSAKDIAKNPNLAKEDLETTRRICQIYRLDPVTVVNFVEGTRFSENKRKLGGDSFQHLLKPKSAGVAFTLNAMGEQFAGILDVTLDYVPTKDNLLWSWLKGKQAEVRIAVQVLPVPAELVAGDYAQDPHHRMAVQQWIGQIWQSKDAQLQQWHRTKHACNSNALISHR